MLASSPTISTSGTDQTTGTSTRISSARPGPTERTSVSVVNGPPDVVKYSMKTSDSVPSDRGSFIGRRRVENPRLVRRAHCFDVHFDLHVIAEHEAAAF